MFRCRTKEKRKVKDQDLQDLTKAQKRKKIYKNPKKRWYAEHRIEEAMKESPKPIKINKSKTQKKE